MLQTWFEGKLDPYSDPQSVANHQTSSLASPQPNGGPTSSDRSSYPISSDNGLVSGFEPSGYPKQMYGPQPKC